ncbi:MAG: YSC84-related protein [Planctomycetota bacterium]
MHRLIGFACACAALAVAGCATPKGSTAQEKRDYALRMRDAALAQLYRKKPGVEALIEKSPGYAVFSNIGAKVFLLSSGHGYGVVVDNGAGRTTYMRMAEVGVGVGLGLKDFRAVFVFHDRKVLDDFVGSGWEFGAEADAAAKSGDAGAAVGGSASITPTLRLEGMDVYQLTEAGLALEATVSGTKYWQDSELNR